VELPTVLTENLKPSFELRPYQIEAFQRFILFYHTPFADKPSRPWHLLFHMATGSGKTLIMAGLILYLYEQGYRHFVFFVHSNNIIEKTRDNFLNPQATKYLFNTRIVCKGREVYIKEADTFDSADDDNVNIKFTTIQQLHLDLNDTRENSVTYEDLSDKKIALIADEAHHLSSATRTNGELMGSWEGTVLRILQQNAENLLLEFTATVDLNNDEVKQKYRDKIVFRYDLAQFRRDRYSKEIHLLRSHFDEQQRIVQALILNIYRQELATRHNINLKPVILFKARRTIRESERNKVNFHNLIDSLTEAQIRHVREKSTIDIVQRAFAFFEEQGISGATLVGRIKSAFKQENCISANNDSEAELNQIRLNTLEDENNPIRAVFAVQKLNEGWDVLNLFDIVRLYEGRDGRAGKPGKTTMSEAQLIGRGARYFPFALYAYHDRFTRKYDDDPAHDFRVLEELYYHTKEDSAYISEIKQVLIDSGIYEDTDRPSPRQRAGAKDRADEAQPSHRSGGRCDAMRTLADLVIAGRPYVHTLSSGVGSVTTMFADVGHDTGNGNGRIEHEEVSLAEIPEHIVRYALSQNPFFYFSNLRKYFPDVASISGFMRSEDYLAGVAITFRGTGERLAGKSNHDYLQAVQGLLETIEAAITSRLTAVGRPPGATAPRTA